MNCVISCLLSEPSTFLIPTSLALLVDLAVERFMKFTDDKIKMSIPTEINAPPLMHARVILAPFAISIMALKIRNTCDASVVAWMVVELIASRTVKARLEKPIIICRTSTISISLIIPLPDWDD